MEFADLRNKVMSWECPPSPPATEVRVTQIKADDTGSSLQRQLDEQAAQLKATQETLSQLCGQIWRCSCPPNPHVPQVHQDEAHLFAVSTAMRLDTSQDAALIHPDQEAQLHPRLLLPTRWQLRLL